MIGGAMSSAATRRKYKRDRMFCWALLQFIQTADPENPKHRVRFQFFLDFAAHYDINFPVKIKETFDNATPKELAHTEYHLPYRRDGNYHVPDHVGDVVRIIPSMESSTVNADSAASQRNDRTLKAEDFVDNDLRPKGAYHPEERPNFSTVGPAPGAQGWEPKIPGPGQG